MKNPKVMKGLIINEVQKIKVSKSGIIETDLYRKPTATNSLLHASSAHPSATIKAIPIDQFLRARRICSDDQVYEQQSADLTQRFLNRGYSKCCIRNGYRRAKKTPREHLLYSLPNKHKENNTNQIRLISTFNNQWEDMKMIFKKLWKILMTDPILQKILPPLPPL
ncbi:unnamed protein product [Ranitomeya imitator]|uniref:Helix-turn-helix domain-containing protein n=1 Tax=Ranitomeya imitator TaxID=111125 RepID=A0ABN9MNX6_9NEOB|nr:unnamed protein product [Ranitomeya imitator]